jgi:hypothetical protein
MNGFDVYSATARPPSISSKSYVELWSIVLASIAIPWHICYTANIAHSSDNTLKAEVASRSPVFRAFVIALIFWDT